MGANQEGVHAAVRAETGTTLDYLSDWHALFTADGIAAGPWNERMIAWVNQILGTSYTSLNDAMNAFAIDQGFERWQDMNTLVLAVSEANQLLEGETQGLAISFTDDFYQADTGFYGSMTIIDTGTPANNYDSSPTTTSASKLTYTSPSVKMCLGPQTPGSSTMALRYQAHNLCLQSETFGTTWTRPVSYFSSVSANATTAPDGTTTADGVVVANASGQASYIIQTITVVSGATYTQRLRVKRGTLSGANTRWCQIMDTNHTNGRAWFDLQNGVVGTKQAGLTTSAITDLGGGWFLLEITYTKANTSTEFVFQVAISDNNFATGVTGNGTDPSHYLWGAQLTRTPADSTYLSTTTAARYALPLEWSSAGVLQGLLVEEARTNLALYASDFTNAAWTKSNMTTAKTATGPDGVANSATTLTATAGNATALQAITSGSAARISNVWIKRRTGSGTVNITSDNGTTWTPVTVTSSWTRVESTVQTLTNPTVGIRIVTSGDAVDVALFGNQVGSFSTSAIETFASTVTRAVDNISLATSAFPYSATASTFTAVGVLTQTYATQQYLCELHSGASTDRIFFAREVAGNLYGTVNSSSAVVATFNPLITAPALGTTYKLAIAATANDFAGVANGGTVLTDASGAMPAAAVSLRLGDSVGGSRSFGGYIAKLVYLPRRASNAELQTLTT